MTKTTSAAATATAGPNVATTLDAREMERALAEPWGAMRCASAYDEDLVEGIKNRFAIMTPFARRGAIGAALFASRRGANFARELARSVGSEDADEWVRALSSAVTSDEWIFDLSGLDSSVPAVSAAVKSIREALAERPETTKSYRPKEEIYLAQTEIPKTEHGHFTLRERRQPKKKPGMARSGTSGVDIKSRAMEFAASRSQTSSIFAPSRKPTSKSASFLRDTGRASSFGSRSRMGDTSRHGSMVIDVAEAAQLGASQSGDPLRQQAQEERERKRLREKEEKEKRIQRLMEEREARKQQELKRKRERDEEISAKKKAYKAEIEAKRAQAQASKEAVATPSPTDVPTTW